MNTYNGWTNYATWRVNLEMLDGMSLQDFTCLASPDVYHLQSVIQAHVEDHIEMTTQAGLGRDYALAFVSDVNWHEIAKHMIADYERDQEAA
jgi:hypothetical protein